MRKAFGQYQTTDPRLTKDLRLFLMAVDKHVPKVRQTLEQLIEKHPEARSADFDSTWFNLHDSVWLESPGFPHKSFRRAVEEWARSFNLTKNGRVPRWVLVTATRTARTPLAFSLPAVSGWAPPIDTSLHVERFPIGEWDPCFGPSKAKTWATIKSELAKLEKHLRGEMDRIESEASRLGLKKASSNFDSRAFEFAARFQCGGQPVATIAEDSQRDHRVIRAAINSVIEAVGLTQRIGKSGPRTKN